MNIAIIFDLNGTIADTEVAHSSAYREAFLEYKIDFPIED